MPSIAVLTLLLGAAAWFAFSGSEEQTEAAAMEERQSRPSTPEILQKSSPRRVVKGEHRRGLPDPGERFQEGPPTPAGAGPEEGSGIALFPPLGTKPVKRGLVVPEDYELPPGYMRHYQTTDDGESVPAILMFQPGFQPMDVDGRPIPVPADRVVPPELAPPGFPLDTLVLPGDRPNETGAARWQRSEER